MPITFPPATEGATYKVEATGVTYVYHSSTNSWQPTASQLTETLEEVTKDIVDLEAQLNTIENTPPDVQLSTEKNTNRVTILVNGSIEKGTAIEPATDYLAGLMSPDDRRHVYSWDPANFYTKDQIDNQFTLRGVGYVYLFSSFGGTIQIRPGEFNTDNRLVGQISFISIAPTDEQGKQLRSAAAGDRVEIYDQLTDNYYTYSITSGSNGSYQVNYVGSEDLRDVPLGIGQPYLIYLYPTHINTGQFYNKDEVNSLFALEDEQPDIFYGDYPPVGTMKDGNIWFDSMNLRISIWSQGAWINPDRNDAGNLEERLHDLEDRVDLLEDN